ncbi:hypothetical protein [Shewanella goraebulensis]|uniref:hypothetical protein n=1 Tax=Shewanella goraebulensis TaxID=3050637 RepID=UPI0025502DD2|nr:hypothetical protein [Shewanella goraebulensis]
MLWLTINSIVISINSANAAHVSNITSSIRDRKLEGTIENNSKIESSVKSDIAKSTETKANPQKTTKSNESNQQSVNKDVDESISESIENSPCYSRSQTDMPLDKTFAYLNTKFCQPAIWFDSFFVDERITDDARAGTIIRWYNDFTYFEKEGFKYRSNIKAHLNLPGMSKKLKLIFDSTGEDDPFSFIKSPDDDNERDVSLRYDWYAKDRTSFNIKASFKPKIEARYRYTYPISQNTLWRFTQTLYQEKKVTGETSEFDFEHAFNDEFLLRWNSAVQYENRNNGWELGTGLQLYQYISDTQAISYQARINGVTEPYNYIETASVGLTYRQNYLREWLFFALTPEYTWTKEEDAERINQVVFTFTLEILFQNI